MNQALSFCNLKTVLLTAGILLLTGFHLSAQEEFDGIRGTQHWMMFSDAPNALYHHLAGEAYRFLDNRSAETAKLQSLQGWQERQAWIRTALQEAVGPFPDKTPLNAKITKSTDKDWYQVQHIIYESQPGYYVTSSLFIPGELKKGKRAPAVIYCSGHADDGYRSPTYQHIILNLVRKGFIVFAFDPVGQGERLQYDHPPTGKSRFRWPSYEHSYSGAQLFITGNTLARNFIWDGIRAVDYLLTREEADPARIGITGRSGGGTQSAFIAAFDGRIKAVAPENYFTNYTRLYQSIGPQDAEQNLFNGIERGLDMADLLAVRAPKPALVITTSRDMFPVQGALETAEEVSKIYKAYGHENDFCLVSDDAPHASTKKNREAMYSFFRQYLDNPGDASDEEIQLLEKEDVQVTATGQLSTSLGGETAFSLNKKDAEERMKQLEAARKTPTGYFSEVLQSAKELSGYREPEETTEPVFTGRIQRTGYTVEKYFVKGEGNYFIPYLLMQPDKPTRKALIYLNPSGKTAASAEGKEMEWFVRNGFTVLAPDMIGTGETGPGLFKGDSYVDSVSYNIWFASMLIGRSITGIQAGDVVRLADLLKKKKEGTELYGLARKQMAPVLLHAAAFDKDIKHIALIEPYCSYRSLVMNRDYQPGFLHSAVPGSIGKYDLPDLAGTLAPRKLLLWGVTDGTGSSTNESDIDKDMQVVRAAYQNRNADPQLQILPAGTVENLQESLKKWMGLNHQIPKPEGQKQIADLIRSTDGLIALWDFKEEGGQKREAYGVGNFPLAEVDGIIPRVEEGPLSGYSAQFGNKAYLSLSNERTGKLNIYGDNQGITVIAWVKWHGGTGFIGGMWNEYQDGGKRQYGLFVSLPYYNGRDQVCGHISKSGKPTAPFPYSIDYSASKQTVTKGEWQCIAMTYDGEWIKSYLNGEFRVREPELIDHTQGFEGYPDGLVQSKNPYHFPDGMGDNGSDFTVGAVLLKSGMGNFFVGQIGGLAVFNRALSDQEIKQLNQY